MKKVPTIRSIAFALALAGLPAMADTYTGPGVANGAGPADGAAISSVVVNNDASTISFTINSTQPMASWIFYAIELQIVGQAGSGDTGLVNPWGQHIGISSGENAVINTYGTGATPGKYSGGWTMGSGISYAAGGTGSSFATITVPLISLGLNVGDSFKFDVVSGYNNTQAAYGALASTGYPAETDNSYTPWNGTASYDSATDANSTFNTLSAPLYTVQAVPEPATWTLLGLGALAMTRRLIRRTV